MLNEIEEEYLGLQLICEEHYDKVDEDNEFTPEELTVLKIKMEKERRKRLIALSKKLNSAEIAYWEAYQELEAEKHNYPVVADYPNACKYLGNPDITVKTYEKMLEITMPELLPNLYSSANFSPITLKITDALMKLAGEPKGMKLKEVFRNSDRLMLLVKSGYCWKHLARDEDNLNRKPIIDAMVDTGFLPYGDSGLYLSQGYVVSQGNNRTVMTLMTMDYFMENGDTLIKMAP